MTPRDAATLIGSRAGVCQWVGATRCGKCSREGYAWCNEHRRIVARLGKLDPSLAPLALPGAVVRFTHRAQLVVALREHPEVTDGR